ncbi:peptidoglycan-binding protein [Agrobacterium vitis]|uniref:peptidoglycan-binding protein n=1 Tax=Agrobacterium vitis TaxID=373 RepID=UPI001F171042|nr:peptidoglycan-binding protein [Agrobacterium vitis]
MRDIQKALVDKGFKPGVPDGVWGKRSIAALRAYQTANGLAPTGVADPATIDRLFPTPPAIEDQKTAVAGSESENVTPLPKVPEVQTKPLGPIDGSAFSTVEIAMPLQQPQSARQVDSVEPTAEGARGDALAPRSSTASSDGKNSSWNLALAGLAVGGVLLFWRRRKQRRQVASAKGMPTAPDSDATTELIWDKDAFRVLTEQSTSPYQDRRPSMDAHNRHVTDWIKANASKAKPCPLARMTT